MSGYPETTRQSKEALDMLRKAKYYISKVDPDLVEDRPSVCEQIAESQEHIRQ